ncbi:MAG: hypothetical protein DWQ19_08740 [Crenarchaeota archaeon]|nr:MAG: hypothetical protein DWQ19_08740 [Thermoproteota archaeon]
MKVVCRSNLDLSPAETWPKELPALPHVGDRINSDNTWKTQQGPRTLQLEVTSITWKWNDTLGWYPEIELHLPKYPWLSIAHFQAWYDFAQGKYSYEYYLQAEERARLKASEERARLKASGMDCSPREA